ncbi:hypothetical protein F0562_016833 [Nyssa sinensis]|uniref:AT-hook motif nuclear-localized protein n=1 Tax=Nyssa sinensis TaxID=561372 RepID=A0A5J4ZH44_9ASTE|nr:hypothetical protein F0562_016833 [Nyssa sinensis]
MDEKESTVSGSPGGNYSEIDSPPMSGGGGVVPQVLNMAANMSTERSLGVTTGGVGVGSGSGGGGSLDLLGKKKRGRPRKYDSDGNLRLSYISPQQVLRPPGFSLSLSPSSDSSKRGRGRPPGSGNWQLLASLGELFANTAGGDFTPHVATVYTGEDVAAKILSFSQKGPRGICILSANGAVSNVTIRQPGSSGGILTYEGRFEILSLTGSFTISENGGVRSRTGGLSVSLAGPDGRVIGGGIAGILVAASPIQIVVGSFMPSGYKAQKRKHNHEPRMAPMIPDQRVNIYQNINIMEKNRNPMEEKKEKVTIRAVSRDDEGRKHVEKAEVIAHKIETTKYIEKKLFDKGIQRLERHPADGLPLARPPPKSGHGGKYTWEGPHDEAENELEGAPPAIDEKDPNYVEEEVEERLSKGEDSEVAGLVVGVVEVPKAAEAKKGVARIEIDPHLKIN